MTGNTNKYVGGNNAKVRGIIYNWFSISIQPLMSHEYSKRKCENLNPTKGQGIWHFGISSELIVQNMNEEIREVYTHQIVGSISVAPLTLNIPLRYICEQAHLVHPHSQKADS